MHPDPQRGSEAPLLARTRSWARSACGVADAVADKNIKNKFYSVGCDFYDTCVVCAVCKECLRTVDTCCRPTLPGYASGCDSCCEEGEGGGV